SVLEGSGGHIVVLTGKDGKLLIDSGITVSKRRITDALDSLSTDPITQLINTHWHVDHTDGNAWVHSPGAVVTAHINTKRHLATATRVEGWQHTFPPALKLCCLKYQSSSTMLESKKESQNAQTRKNNSHRYPREAGRGQGRLQHRLSLVRRRPCSLSVS